MHRATLAPPTLLFVLFLLFGSFGALGTLTFAPPAAAQSIRFDRGHIDAFHVTVDDGRLILNLKEDITGSGVQRTPEDVALVVTNDAWSDATAGVDGIGKPTFYLPQTQDQNLIWPGWDTQGVAAGGHESVDINFEQVAGPGDIYLFETGGLGGINPVLNDGSLALTSGSTVTQAHPAHRHVNWAFTEPGQYTMTVSATADNATTNSATYTWNVGDGAAATPANPAAGAEAAGASTSDRGPEEASTSDAARTTDEKCTPGILPMIKDDRGVPPTWRSPAELEFGLGDAAKKQLPEAVGPVAAGEAWMIGAIQEAGVPWLGANTQHPTMLENQLGDVTWELVSFDGPGAMVVYTQGGLGQIMGEEWFRGADGRAQGSRTIAPNTHVHPVWLFSAPGTYKVGIRQSAEKDGKVYSGTDVITFQVGGAGGNATDGHFDLGGQFDPAGGDCAAGGSGTSGTATSGAAGGSSQAGAAAPAAKGKGTLADTGTSMMTLPFAILGVGLLAFGIGVVRFAYAMGRAHQ